MTTVHPPAPQAIARPNWGGGRVAMIIIGSVFGLIGAVIAVGGGVAAWADGNRDRDGFLLSSSAELSSDGYALRLPSIDVEGAGWADAYAQDALGVLRITATGADRPVFVGVGPAADVARYLAGVQHDDLDEVWTSPFRVAYRAVDGGAPSGPPAAQHFWVATGDGTQTQVLTWEVADGDWSVVMMNADGSSHIRATVTVGATIPIVHRLAVGLLIGGGLIVMIGLGLVLISILSYRRQLRRYPVRRA